MLTVGIFSHVIRKVTRNFPMKGWDQTKRLFVISLTHLFPLKESYFLNFHMNSDQNPLLFWNSVLDV